MPKGRTPDFNLWAGNDSGTGRCGAAWKNEDGSISIALDPWAILRGKGHAGGAQTVKLFPYGSTTATREAAKEAAGSKTGTLAKGKFDDLDDDIPF